MTSTLLIDVGATAIKYGTLAGATHRERPTPPNLVGAISLLQDIASELPHYESVIVGVPGIVSTDGFVLDALYSPFKHVDLTNIVEDLFSATVITLNDAKLQAHRYLDRTNHLHITIGTAVGGAIIVDGEILHGRCNQAGEVGHIPTLRNNRRCPCGRVGCLDTLSSGWSLQADLGPHWWLSALPQKSERLTLAAAAVNDAVATIGVVFGLDTWSIAGSLCAHEAFRNSLAKPIAGHESWHAPQLDHISASGFEAARHGAISLTSRRRLQ